MPSSGEQTGGRLLRMLTFVLDGTQPLPEPIDLEESADDEAEDEEEAEQVDN